MTCKVCKQKVVGRPHPSGVCRKCRAKAEKQSKKAAKSAKKG